MTEQARARDGSTTPYIVAIFLGSALLFLIEPIAGKRILPLLGGSAAVWTACLVFYQLALLLGYFMAHWMSTRLRPRAQSGVYVGLLLASLLQLLVASRAGLSADAVHPIVSVLLLLAELIGLPFVTLAASGPLLQAWCARTTDNPHPYRLYVVSNVGSLLGLLVYPWLIEPRATLHAQSTILTVGLALLAVVGAVIARGLASLPMSDGPSDATSNAADRDRPSTIALWVSLAACGSLLLSAVTIYISQNVATIPLLWIIPLVAYLLSFIVAFSNERWHPRPVVLALAAIATAGAAYRQDQGDLYVRVPAVVAIYCGALFAICLFCHSELYRRRPPAARLTAFYFWLAAGGALGAILVGIVAPMVLFGNYELLIGFAFAALLAFFTTWASGWPARYFWGISTLFLGGLVVRAVRMDIAGSIARERNFYGTLFVHERENVAFNATMRTLYHGVIEHGQQVYRADLDTAPTTYYGHPSGVGLAIDHCCDGRPRRIGVIGLGTGTLAAYGRPGDVIRFYDINPAVEPIARGMFTYLRKSKAAIDVVNGDARVSLAREAPQNYDVLAIDAFSGDAIPVHLITTEALDVYRRHLAAGGVIAFHVSNRYLDLAPVVKQLADHAGMKSLLIATLDVDKYDLFGADWVLVTENGALLQSIASATKDTETIKPIQGLRLWTDDYNSLLPIIKLRKAN